MKVKWGKFVFIGIIIIALAVGGIIIGTNFDKIKGWFTGQITLYTQDDINQAFNDGASQSAQIEQTLRDRVRDLTDEVSDLNLEVSSLETQIEVKLSDILDLTGQISSLDGQIDSLNDIISARNLTIEGLNEDIAELQAEVLNLREQLLGVFERQYNTGFDDGVKSIDVDAIYQQAYDTGYDAGYAHEEHIYEQQELNINVVWDGSIDTTWYTADKQSLDSTFDNITGWYLIYKPSQLAGLAQLVNSGIDFEGQTIGILNHLYLNDSTINLLNYEDLTNEEISNLNEWTPIGTLENNFKGTLYGGIHFISGLFIDNSSLDYAGLFGSVEGATVYNIGLENSYINANTYVGALAGFTEESNINKVTVHADVKADSYVGGLIGSASNTNLTDMYVTTNINAKTYVGGLIGSAHVVEINNINMTTNIVVIDGPETLVGGLIGKLTGEDNNNENIIENINARVTISAPDATPGYNLHNKYYTGFIGRSYTNNGNSISNVLLLVDLPTELLDYSYSYVLGSLSSYGAYTPYQLTINNFKYLTVNDSTISLFTGTNSSLDISKNTNITASMIKEYSYIEIITELTCEVDGVMYIEDEYSGYTATIITPALGHNWVLIERIEPTHESEGYILYRCTNCGDEYTETLPMLNFDDYIITYNLNGGTNSGSNPTTYTEISQTITLQPATRIGYTFDGWYDNAAFNNDPITQIENGSTGNKTFYAKWTIINYTITIVLNGGNTTYTFPSTYNVESDVINIEDYMFTRTGYTCIGLSGTDIEGISTCVSIYQENGPDTGNKTYYVEWEANQYIMHYDLNGGYLNGPYSTSKTVYYGSNIGSLGIDVRKDGYMFEGWYIDGDKISSSTAWSWASDKTAVANWVVIPG